MRLKTGRIDLERAQGRSWALKESERATGQQDSQPGFRNLDRQDTANSCPPGACRDPRANGRGREHVK